MALEYTIDDARQLVIVTGEYADAPEWQNLLDRVVADPRRRAGMAVLRDQRDGIRPVDAATVVAIMDVVRRYWGPLEFSRAAILMPHDLDPPALVAHAIADADRMPIQAFTSYDAALEWLGRRDDARIAPDA